MGRHALPPELRKPRHSTSFKFADTRYMNGLQELAKRNRRTIVAQLEMEIETVLKREGLWKEDENPQTLQDLKY